MRDAGDHENVCRLLDAFEDHRGVSLVMDHCAGGTLLGALRRARAAASRASPAGAAPAAGGAGGARAPSGAGTPSSKGSSSPSAARRGQTGHARAAARGRREFIGKLQPHQARRVARRKPLESEARGAIPPELARPAMLAMARAVRHLHRRGIAHRDVKLENVVVDGSAAGTGASDAVAAGRIRLCDFGFATRVQSQASADKEAARAFGAQLAVCRPNSRPGTGRGPGGVGLTPPPPLPPHSPAGSATASQRSVSPPMLPPSPAGFAAAASGAAAGKPLVGFAAASAATQQGVTSAGSPGQPSAGRLVAPLTAMRTAPADHKATPTPGSSHPFGAAAGAAVAASAELPEPLPDEQLLASASFGSDGQGSICERHGRPSTPSRRTVAGGASARPLGLVRGPASASQRLSAATPPPLAAPSPPPSPPQRVTEARGSLVYMAPEALVRGHTHHARPTDVWSLGVCFYLMLTGSFPFRGDSEAEVVRMVRTRPPNAKADGLPAGHPASELTLRLLDRSAATRPTAEAVCADPWLRGGAAGERSPEAQDGGDVATQAELVDVTTIPTAPVPVRPRAAGRPALAVDVSDAADSKPLAGMSADRIPPAGLVQPAPSQPAPIPPASPFPARLASGEGTTHSPRSGQRISPRSCASSNSSSTQSLPRRAEPSPMTREGGQGVRRPVAGGIGIGATSPRAAMLRAKALASGAGHRQRPQQGLHAPAGASVRHRVELVGPAGASHGTAGSGGVGCAEVVAATSAGRRDGAGPASVISKASSRSSRSSSSTAAAGRSEQLRAAIRAGRARRGTAGRPPAQPRPTAMARRGSGQAAAGGGCYSAGGKAATGPAGPARQRAAVNAKQAAAGGRPRSGATARGRLGLSRIRPGEARARAGAASAARDRGGDARPATRPVMLPALQALMPGNGLPSAEANRHVGGSARTERRPMSAARTPVASRVSGRTAMPSRRTSTLGRILRGEGAARATRPSGAAAKQGQVDAETKADALKSELK